jgi:hypothetical protein
VLEGVWVAVREVEGGAVVREEWADDCAGGGTDGREVGWADSCTNGGKDGHEVEWAGGCEGGAVVRDRKGMGWEVGAYDKVKNAVYEGGLG